MCLVPPETFFSFFCFLMLDLQYSSPVIITTYTLFLFALDYVRLKTKTNMISLLVTCVLDCVSYMIT